MGVTVKATFTPGGTRGRSTTPEQSDAASVETIPRSARLMALAIVLDEMVRSGKAESYAEIARVAGVSRTWLTRVMQLVSLAPELQRSLLDACARSTASIPASPSINWRQQRLHITRHNSFR